MKTSNSQYQSSWWIFVIVMGEFTFEILSEVQIPYICKKKFDHINVHCLYDSYVQCVFEMLSNKGNFLFKQ